MKLYCKKLGIVLLAIVMLLCVGCTEQMKEENAEIRANVEAFLSAAIAKDEEAAYAVVISEIDRESFHDGFLPIAELLSDVTEFELKQIGIHYTIQNGVSSTQVNYLVTSNAGKFVVGTLTVDGYEGLTSLNITPYEKTALSYSGTITRMKDATVGQWIMLLVGIATVLFEVAVLVDCFRRKLRMKVLWIVINILGAVVLTLTLSASGIHLNAAISWLLSLSGIIKYGDGSFAIRFVVPLGALIYLVMRKKFTIPPVDASVADMDAPVIADEAPFVEDASDDE